MTSIGAPSHQVLWHEGMFLAPQHFQQWDRHLDWRLGRLTRALRPDAYGLTALAIDARALASGSFALISADGVMPDGHPFSIGDDGDAVLSRQLELPPGTPSLAIYLAMPASGHGVVRCSEGGSCDGQPTRFRRRSASLRDHDARDSQREIAVAAPNLRLVLEGEPLDGQVWIKLAEVARNAAGALTVSDRHAPPCLALSASPLLRSCLRRCVEIVIGRAAEWSAQRRSRVRGKIEVSASDVASHLMLHALNGAIPRLAHLLDQRDCHPEEAFLALAGLTGQLCTLAPDLLADGLPRYRHEVPLAAFTGLEAALRSLLDIVIPTRYVPLALHRSGERVLGAVLPEHVLDDARIYLSVSSPFPAERVLREVPLKAKVASVGRMDVLISQALRGLRLSYLSVPPSEIPVQPGCAYFEIAREGDEWTQARDTRSLAIYLPPDFSDARLEFLAVKE